MKDIVISQRVVAPVERVFARATDFAQTPEVIEGVERVEMLTDGETRVGTRFRETRKMFGREATEEMEVTELTPPSGYVLETESHGAHYSTRFSFTPDGEGTIIQMRFTVKPLSFAAKVMMKLMSPMAKGISDMIKKDLSDIARALEAEARSSSSAQPK